MVQINDNGVIAHALVLAKMVRVCVSCLQTELYAKCTFLPMAEDGEAQTDHWSERTIVVQI